MHHHALLTLFVTPAEKLKIRKIIQTTIKTVLLVEMTIHLQMSEN